MTNILIAEDNEINRLLLVSIINSILPTAKVIEATDGVEAIEKFLTFTPDLIFMDVRMPSMSGLEATIKIRSYETKKRIPIIALTASAQETDRDRCIKSGMDDFISKPIKSDSITRILHKWLPSDNTTP